MTTYSIRRLTAVDSESAGALLARAFIDAPLFVAALPDRTRRAALSPALFTANIRYAGRYGEAWGIGAEDEPLLGVAYWIGMPEGDVTPERAAEFGFDLIFQAWGGALDLVVEAETSAIAAMPDQPAHWRYLQMIGIEPGQQGRGLGSALLAHLIAGARAAGDPLILVTDHHQNCPLYRRAGFVDVWSGRTHDGHVPLWTFRAD